jgi:hypothetical protein
MSCDVWLKRDIANALTAAYQAQRETMTATAPNPQYAAGYRAALSTVALFFGIAPGLVIPALPERTDKP